MSINQAMFKAIQYLSFFVTFCLPALFASAQQPRGPEGIEEVIVTAQKRQQSLQEIPLSVRAIGQEELERISALTFEDFARGQAGLSFNANGRYARGGVTPVIRGVAQLNPQGPTAAFYLDETPLQPQETERVGIPDPNMFDINRVELLRGPQGDLYGSSAMGGTIRVIPNKPGTEAYEGRLDLKLNTLSDGGTGGEANAMLNLPLNDTAAIRLVGSYAHEAGWIDLVGQEAFGTTDSKDVNETDSYVVRAILQWEPSEKLTVTPSFFWQKAEEDRARYISHDLSKAADKHLDIDYGNDEFSTNEFRVSNLLIEYELGWGTLTSSTTDYELEWENQLATSGIINLVVGPPIEANVLWDVGSEDQFVQELRLVSDLEGPFNFIIGAFYREIEHDFFQDARSQRFLQVFGTDIIVLKEGEVEKLDETAFFGQVTWSFAEDWEAAFGLRYFDYERDRLTPTVAGIFGFPERVDEISEDGVSPTFTLRWFASEDVMVYGRAANGFRPGFGFSTIFPPPCFAELAELGIDPAGGVGTVDADDLWSYELGTKASLANNRLVVNASVYQQDWTDLQTAVGLDCGFLLSTNAGKATVEGFEIETQAQLGDALTLSVNLGYTDATLAEDAPDIGGFDGDRLPGVSEWQIGAAVEYHFTLAGNESYFRVDFNHNSDYFFDFDDADKSARNRQPSLSLVGLRLGTYYKDWQLALYMKNVTDEFKLGMCGADSAFRLMQPDYSTCGVKPRQIGINISKQFN